MPVPSQTFVTFLEAQTQEDWDLAVEKTLQGAHPVDQAATRIWFSFWPLRLFQAFEQSDDLKQTVRDLELDGSFRLSDNIDSSVGFFHASGHWRAIKTAEGGA